jgi:geranylgeranyl diphosphate synthase type I
MVALSNKVNKDMSESNFEAVFSHLGVIGSSVEQKMYDFLLKDIHPDFKDLVKWQTHTGGKRLRPGLTLLFAQAFGVSSDDSKALSAAAGIELIHTYSLILDDIIDRGDLRRGKPTTRAKYGDEFAILSAIIHREAVYEAAKATEEYFSKSLEIYSNAIRRLTEGERLDILFEQKEDRPHEYFMNNKYTSVSIEDYENMINGKTASLITAACEIGALVGGASKNDQNIVVEYGHAVGIAFQIADDYLDIFTESDKFGKVVYKDIIEQKLGNFVIVHTLKLLNEKDGNLLSNYLIDRNLTDNERIAKCMPLIEKSNTKELVMKEAMKWVEKAQKAVSQLKLKNEELRSILNSIAEFSVKRAF